MINSKDILIFPETILEYQLSFKDDSVLNYLKYKHEFKESLHGFSYSLKDDSILDNKSLTSLKKQILDCCDHFINNKFKYDVKCKIVDSWATQCESGGVTDRHNHANSWISGVFYPDLGESKIKFFKNFYTDFFNVTTKEFNVYNAESMVFSFKKNTLLLWKSYIQHESVAFIGEGKRYSIAFNIMPVGTIGMSTSRLTLT